MIKVGYLLISFCSAQLKVLLPESLASDTDLFDDGVVYGTTAVFGTPEYGRRVIGALKYKAPNDIKKPHCEKSDFPDAPTDPDTKSFALVRRGGCTFVSKVRLAQDHKMSGVVVVDEPCSEQEKSGNSCRDADAVQRIIMADDGTGDDIHIPSILVPAAQGDALIAAVQAGGETTPVLTMMLWDLPRSDFVTFDFWMSSGAGDAMDFLASVKPVVDALQGRVQFTPHFFIVDTYIQPFQSSCLPIQYEGRTKYYCDPLMSKQEVVREDLRQLCIWHKYKKPLENVIVAPEYWSYIEVFFNKCHPSSTKTRDTFTESCSNSAIASLGLDRAAIDYCMTSYKPPSCQKGDLTNPACSVDYNLVVEEARHRAWSPHAVRINGWRYSGPLDANAIARQICSGFLHWPDECDDAISDKVPTVGHGISFSTLFALLLLLAAAAAVAFLIYRQRMTKTLYTSLREEVMLEVRAQMQDYTMLAEQGDAPLFRTPPARIELTRLRSSE